MLALVCLGVAISAAVSDASPGGVDERPTSRVSSRRTSLANDTDQAAPGSPTARAPTAAPDADASTSRAPTSGAPPAASSSANSTPRSRATDPVQRGERTGVDQSAGSRRLRVSGWTNASFTASTDAHQQLPMGFNYRANQFLLQQNWLRIERAAPSSGSQRGFGFLSDTILPGSDYTSRGFK